MKKLNEIQKIIITFYVILLSSICLFYLPFYSGEYSTIWSNNRRVDLSKLIVLIFILSVIFFTAFKFSESFDNYDEAKRKKILKNELKIFLLFLLINFSFLVFYYSYNGINYLQEIELLEKINSNEVEIEKPLLKKERRREFWDFVSYQYDMSEFNSRIDKLWSFMMENKDDKEWLEYYLSNLDNEGKIKFNIKNPQEFIEFIENYNWSEQDILLEKNKIFLESEIIENKEKIKNLSYYNSEIIRANMAYVFFTTLIIFYLMRIFVLKIIKILKD